MVKSLVSLSSPHYGVFHSIYLQVFLAIVALALAESEPDPWLYYSLIHPAPWTFYPHHVGAHYYYGKRSAEAEPAPYYLYHGYHYPKYAYHGLGYNHLLIH